MNRKASSGFTLIEILVVLTILTVAVGAMVNAVANVTKLVPTNQESARALDAARSAIEEMKGIPFDDLYATYNASPDDDPDGVGTAPGCGFPVAGLDVVEGDADGMVGEILFPEVTGQLREDCDDVRLGMPVDLNLDGILDSDDRSADYRVLPFCVRLEWTGSSGPRSLELITAVTRP